MDTLEINNFRFAGLAHKELEMGAEEKEVEKEIENKEILMDEMLADNPRLQDNYESNVFNNYGPNFFDNVQPLEKNMNNMNSKGQFRPAMKSKSYFHMGNMRPHMQASNLESNAAVTDEEADSAVESRRLEGDIEMGSQRANGGYDAHMHLDEPDRLHDDRTTMQENYESNVFNNYGPNFFDNTQPLESNINDIRNNKMRPTMRPKDHYFYFGNMLPHMQSDNLESTTVDAKEKETRMAEGNFQQTDQTLLEQTSNEEPISEVQGL